MCHLFERPEKNNEIQIYETEIEIEKKEKEDFDHQ
jgi:hypothetical protein